MGRMIGKRAGGRGILIALCLCAVACLPLIGEDELPVQVPDVKPEVVTQEAMVEAIVTKNIFKPARMATPERKSPKAIVVPELGPQSLNRPFTVIGVDQADNVARAHLLFGNPTERRVVNEGDVIEVVTILKINPTYLMCLYDGQEVRIDVGESSDDALNHLKGFGDFSDFLGTTTVGDESYATFFINGRYRRVGVGDWLGDYEVIKIEEGNLWLKLIDEPAFIIEASPRE